MKNHSIYWVLGLLILLGGVLAFYKTSEKDVNPADKISIVTSSTTRSVEASQFNPFDSRPREANTSSIVGYFAHGSFFWYVPDWVEQNWSVTDFNGEGMRLSPKDANLVRQYSDILIAVNPSTENYNAATLYDQDRTDSRSGKLVLNEVLLNKHTDNGGPTISMETNTRIYHVQHELENKIVDRYYIDGSGGKTLYVSFSAPVTEYYKYENAIRGLVEGIGKGETPQG